MRIFPLILSLSLSVPSAMAVEEAQIENLQKSKITPFVLNQIQQRQFVGVGQRNINYYVFQADRPKGVLILSPDQSEAALKYSELLYDLKDFGYTIFILDHRGQGESDRLLPDPYKTHVEKFSDYSIDFQKFLQEKVQPAEFKSAYIVGNGMGGLIASAAIEKLNVKINGLFLTNPYFELNTEVFGAVSEESIMTTELSLGLPASYAKSSLANDATSPFAQRELATRVTRQTHLQQLKNNNKKLYTLGVTNQWLKEIVQFSQTVRKQKDFFKIPTLILHGSKSSAAKLSSQMAVCGLSPKLCSVLVLPDGANDLFHDVDGVRNFTIDEFKKFIRKNSP